jgi:hypothetical protein
MYKRVLDGTGVWKSDKIARIEPEWMRAEYANWIPLALANGAFEADTRRIWATIYSYNRPDISFDDAEEVKREFCRVGLLFLWPDQASGKIWGYFTGIEKPGRLPARSRLDKKHEPIGPTPPANALRSYVELTRAKALDAAVVSQWLANGCLGFGIGIGLGLGSGSGESAKPRTLSPPASAAGVSRELLSYWNENRKTLPEVLKLTRGREDKISARLKADEGFEMTFKAAMTKALSVPFLCGAGKLGWKVNFDWLIANDRNCLAVIEGNYDDGKEGIADARTARNIAISGAQLPN